MENQNENLSLTNRHLGSFWPIVALCTISAIVGGIVVWAAYDYGLQTQLDSIFFNTARTSSQKKHVSNPPAAPTTQTKLK